MSYSEYTWQTGETITAEKLNNIEEGVQEALEYDAGYECAETSVEVFNGSLTPTTIGNFYGASFTPSQPITSEEITITLNGTDYILPKVIIPQGIIYGEADAQSGPIFTHYPCAILIGSDYDLFATPSSGTYQITIKLLDTIINNITAGFKKVVKTVVDEARPNKHIVNAVETGTGTYEFTFDTTPAQVREWVKAGEEVEVILEKQYSYVGSYYIHCPLTQSRQVDGSGYLQTEFIGFGGNTSGSTISQLTMWRISTQGSTFLVEHKDVQFIAS